VPPEEQLIQRYFDAFNRHDIERGMACFHEELVIIGAKGKRWAGCGEVRRSYESEFAMFPDGDCDLRLSTGNSGQGFSVSPEPSVCRCVNGLGRIRSPMLCPVELWARMCKSLK
jgi:hypothetical protein